LPASGNDKNHTTPAFRKKTGRSTEHQHNTGFSTEHRSENIGIETKCKKGKRQRKRG
jgi:hypothetical protein